MMAHVSGRDAANTGLLPSPIAALSVIMVPAMRVINNSSRGVNGLHELACCT